MLMRLRESPPATARALRYFLPPPRRLRAAPPRDTAEEYNIPRSPARYFSATFQRNPSFREELPRATDAAMPASISDDASPSGYF